MPQLDSLLLRRAARVCARMSEDDPADAVLDDFFVLWRAFEGTWPLRSKDSQSQKCREAVALVVSSFPWSELRRLRRFIDSLSSVDGFSAKEVKRWFDVDWHEMGNFFDDIRVMNENLQFARWTTNDSAVLADVLYRIRSAVVHSALDTISAGRLGLFPIARDAVLEVALAHGAAQAGKTVQEAESLLKKEVERCLSIPQ